MRPPSTLQPAAAHSLRPNSHDPNWDPSGWHRPTGPSAPCGSRVHLSIPSSASAHQRSLRDPSAGCVGLRYAAQLPLKDFEDAMQVAAAEACGADVIATRNVRDYTKAPIRAATPQTLLGQIDE